MAPSTPSRKWATPLRSPASAFVRSKRRRCASCAIPHDRGICARSLKAMREKRDWPVALGFRGHLLKCIRFDLLRANFYFARLVFSSFLAKQCGIYLQSLQHVRVIRTQVFLADLYSPHVE